MVCPCGAVSGQQVVEGEGVYKCGAVHSPVYEDGTDSEFQNVGN